MIDLEALSAELQGSAYTSLITAGRHNAVADLLNERNIPARKERVYVKDEIEPFLSNSGVMLEMEKMLYRPDDQFPQGVVAWEVKAQVSAIKRILNTHDWLNLDLPLVQSMVQGFLLLGVLTEQQADDFDALADTQISRAEQLFGAGAFVSHMDIAEALNG